MAIEVQFESEAGGHPWSKTDLPTVPAIGDFVNCEGTVFRVVWRAWHLPKDDTGGFVWVKLEQEPER